MTLPVAVSPLPAAPEIHDALVLALLDLLPAHTEGMLSCTRVWAAWGVGTMGEDDFVPISDDLDALRDIAHAVAAQWQTTEGDDAARVFQGLKDGLGQTLMHETGWPCAPESFTSDAFFEVAEHPAAFEALVAPVLAACRAVAASRQMPPERPRSRLRV